MMRIESCGRRPRSIERCLMRFAQIGVVTLTLCGCSDSPVAPSAVSPQIGEPLPMAPLYWDVFEERADGSAGLCIIGATVEIINGEFAGRSARTHCPDPWAVPWEGFFLPEGSYVTLRVSAPGYVTQEKTAEAKYAPPPGNIVSFGLRKVG